MLYRPQPADQAIATAVRIPALDRARTFITLLVVLHHAVINYTWFGQGDSARWLGFDLVVLFNDSFFMACMFFISGLFVQGSLARRGAVDYLASRAWRLGVPFLVSIFVVIPIAYYPSFVRYHPAAGTDLNFFHYVWQMMTVGPWPSGAAWFLWVLLALDAVAALLWGMARPAVEALGRAVGTLRGRPVAAFATFSAFSVAIYLPLRLIFGDTAWLVPGHYPFPIQASRILLYGGYFFAGMGIGAAGLKTGLLARKGALARHWRAWFGFALLFYGVIVLLVYAHHNWISNFNAPAMWWQITYGLAFALFSAAMTFTLPAFFLRYARWSFSLLDAMQPQAYGIYLLHFIPLIWLQYAVYDPPLPAFAKFAIVFVGTLSISWALTALLRKIPVVARMI